MYLEVPSSERRQGDVLRGRSMVGVDVQVRKVEALLEAARTGQDYKLQLESNLRNDLYLVLSQCCDLKDPRVLIAPLLPGRAVPWQRLTPNQQTAFRANLLGEDSSNGVGGGPGTTPDGERMPRLSFVLPGYYYLEPLSGVIQEASVVQFSLARGVRRNDFEALEKVAELTLEARDRLRQRLSVFFGRVPDEDL